MCRFEFYGRGNKIVSAISCLRRIPDDFGAFLFQNLLMVEPWQLRCDVSYLYTQNIKLKSARWPI